MKPLNLTQYNVLGSTRSKPLELSRAYAQRVIAVVTKVSVHIASASLRKIYTIPYDKLIGSKRYESLFQFEINNITVYVLIIIFIHNEPNLHCLFACRVYDATKAYAGGLVSLSEDWSPEIDVDRVLDYKPVSGLPIKIAK